jgi:hypothetical protein
MCSGQPSGNTNNWITMVIPNGPSAERRDASPTSSSTENMCSPMVAMYAAKSGGSSGTLYSSRNRKNVSSRTENPLTLVCAERQNTLASAKRDTSATAL